MGQDPQMEGGPSKQEAEAMIRQGLQHLRTIADRYGLDFAGLVSDASAPKEGIPFPKQSPFPATRSPQESSGPSPSYPRTS